MSKIESNVVRTNLDESSCALKITPSSPDWDADKTHDKNRGRVIAFARLIDTSFRKIFTKSCVQPGSRRLHADHPYKITKYILLGINLFNFHLRIISHSLDLITSHVCALSICRRLTGYQDKYCGFTNITVLKPPNY